MSKLIKGQKIKYQIVNYINLINDQIKDNI